MAIWIPDRRHSASKTRVNALMAASGMTSMMLMRARDAELDRLFQRHFHFRGRHQRQRVGGDGAVMTRAADRILNGVMLGHQRDGVIEIAVPDHALRQPLIPESAFTLAAAPE